MGSHQIITLGEKQGVCANAKLWCKLTPNTFLLAPSSLGKSLIYCVRIFLGYTYWVYNCSLLKFYLEKIVKLHTEQLHAHNWYFFGIRHKKNKSSFSVMLNYSIHALCFWAWLNFYIITDVLTIMARYSWKPAVTKTVQIVLTNWYDLENVFQSNPSFFSCSIWLQGNCQGRCKTHWKMTN